MGVGYEPRLVGAIDPSSVEDALHCPHTCVECPGWSSDAAEMWLIVLLLSLTTPVLVTLSLRFLRGPSPTGG